jgi:ubiquinone/menaquinone biosynthesis C-methylase UbiE
MHREPYSIYVSDGIPSITDDLPSGYSFNILNARPLPPIPPMMHAKAMAWIAFLYTKLLANRKSCIVKICHAGRVVHRSCVRPRYFRWPFMGEDDLRISSTWTHAEFRGKGLATIALAYIVRTMAAPRRRFWYVSKDSNVESVRVCRRVGFDLIAYAQRLASLSSRSPGQLSAVTHTRAQTDWYASYYAKAGADRNDLRRNTGVLFQTLATERSLIRAFYDLPSEITRGRVLDVGCGSGSGWYQLFRLGVCPQKTVGVDIQFDRLARLPHLYPQCAAINADGNTMPFANGSFDLVFESTMFATLPDESMRVGIAAEMVRVCKPGGHLLLIDWRTKKFWDPTYKALTKSELRRLFALGTKTRLVGIYRGALIPPLGRFLSSNAGSLYFLVAGLCPALVGQVAYLLRRNPESQESNS